MLRATIQAIMSGFTAVALFTLGWIWYYVTLGWRWYVNKVKEYRKREFFTWRYRMTAVLIFALVYLFVLRKFGHK
jgi:multisubunit Na+/H+ antiporter MnhB subunit